MSDEPICPQEVDCVPEQDLPSITQMAKNLMSDGGKILKNAVQGNKNLVDDDVRTTRWSICTSCPRLTEKDRCLECGCFMKVKVAFVTSKCPLEKW